MDHSENDRKEKNLIQYCPLCGYKSNKDFGDGEIEYGGDWICENCDERVEAYLLAREEELEVDSEDNKQGMSISIPLITLIVIVVFIYFFIQS